MVEANTLAIVKKDTVDVVAKKIREFQERGEIHFPANYSPDNAMKAAWLAVQAAEDKDHHPALEVCTKNSIANALLNMVVQGLTPAKKQCYFIVYGKELVCQRSYFGTMAVAKMVDPTIRDIVAQVIYEGDECEYEIDGKGRKHLVKHIQALGNINKDKIRGAYCTIIWDDGRTFLDVMSIEQIKQAWQKSKTKPILENGSVKPNSTHSKFTADMATKTVINRACKFYINSSNDSSLVIEHFHHAEEVAEAAMIEDEIATQANQEVIDVTPEPAALPAVQSVQDKVDEAEHVCVGEPPKFPGEEAATAERKPGF